MSERSFEIMSKPGNLTDGDLSNFQTSPNSLLICVLNRRIYLFFRSLISVKLGLLGKFPRMGNQPTRRFTVAGLITRASQFRVESSNHIQRMVGNLSILNKNTGSLHMSKKFEIGTPMLSGAYSIILMANLVNRKD